MGVQLDGVTITDDEPLADDAGAQAAAADAEAREVEQATEAVVDTDSEAADPGELVISFGEEQPAEDEDLTRAPAWVKDLRKANRDKERKIRELEQRLAAAAPAPDAIVVGEKPTLQSCGYDENEFDRQLTEWHDKKRQADEAQRKKAETQEAAQRAWQARLDAYGKAKADLKVKDFDDAEDAARDVLSTVQQGVIVNGADNPALLVYALGRNPKKAKELAAISDPVKFAFAVAKLEAQMKVAPRKTAPVPEKVVRGSTPAANIEDKTIEKLREKAAQTGDLTELNRYRRQMREKQRA